MFDKATPHLKTVLLADFQALSAKAQGVARARANLNLHPQLDDPVQRFLNAIEPGSYVRPHRHAEPQAKWELFVVLSGAVAVLVLDDAGVVQERVVLDAAGDCRAVEIPAGAWHTLAALVAGTVLFECKQGPYQPASDKDFAPWAPREGEAGAAALAARIAQADVGAALAEAA